MQDFWTALFNKFSSRIFPSSPAFLPSLGLSVKWGGGLKVTEGRCFLSLVLKCFVKVEIVEKDKSTEAFLRGRPQSHVGPAVFALAAALESRSKWCCDYETWAFTLNLI